MNSTLRLLSLILLLIVSGSANAQTSSLYTGTFTNTTLTQGGNVKVSMTFTLPDSIHGYTNFTELVGQSPLCGAGTYKGRFSTDSIFLSFTSHDTDSGCGFDYGWLFSLRGRFYHNKDSIAGFYSINNANNETGFFNIKRPSESTAVGFLGNNEGLFYPNPSNGALTLKLPQHLSESVAIITNPFGTKVLVKQLNAATTEISLDVPDGLYFISIVSDGKQVTQKLVIRH